MFSWWSQNQDLSAYGLPKIWQRKERLVLSVGIGTTHTAVSAAYLGTGVYDPTAIPQTLIFSFTY